MFGVGFSHEGLNSGSAGILVQREGLMHNMIRVRVIGLDKG